MQELTSTTPTPERLDELIATARENTPPEIETDAHTFLADLRVIADAFAAAGAAERQLTDLEVERVLNSLTVQERLFLEDLAVGQETGLLPDNSTGRVVTYMATRCT